MRASLKIRATTFFTATALALPVLSAVVVTPAEASTTGNAIVAIAQRELNDTSRNYEVGTNCSYYGGVMFGWPACGGKAGWGGGTSDYAWCAAFSKYVWREGGVTTDLNQITGMAASFRTYGVNHETWHARGSYVPQAGDAVVFDWQQDGIIDHVGIVNSVSGGTLHTIEGNSSDRVKANTYPSYASDVDIVGFTTAADVAAGTTTRNQTDDDPTRAPSVKADFNNDGKEDIAVFNDMGNGGLRMSVQYGGQTAMQQVWDAPNWGAPVTSMRFVAGHFGYGPGSDVVGFLDYGNGHLGVWVWQGNNLGSPFHPIDAPSWGYSIADERLVTGDYNNDGNTDIAVFTDMGGGAGGHLREHVIYGGQWNLGLQQVWDAPNWGFPISNMRFVAGHFGYSAGTDIVAFQDYGNGHLGVWVWQGKNLDSPIRPIDAPSWGYSVADERLVTGDYNNDGNTDIAAVTDLGGGHLREHVIYGGQWNLGLQRVWDAPNWGFPISNMRFVAGHFGYGPGSDVVGFLDYGNGHLGVWVWQGNNLGSPFHPIDAPSWGEPITNSRITTGDYSGAGNTDITAVTDLGGGHLREHVIYEGQWNLGLQQVWDAPNWGFPITNLRLVQ